MNIGKIAQINEICPCWLHLADGTKLRCERITGVKGGLTTQEWSVLAGGAIRDVACQSVVSAENIEDPARRID